MQLSEKVVLAILSSTISSTSMASPNSRHFGPTCSLNRINSVSRVTSSLISAWISIATATIITYSRKKKSWFTNMAQFSIHFWIPWKYILSHNNINNLLSSLGTCDSFLSLHIVKSWLIAEYCTSRSWVSSQAAVRNVRCGFFLFLCFDATVTSVYIRASGSGWDCCPYQ